MTVVYRPWPFEPLKPFGYDIIVIDPPWRWKGWSEKGNWKGPNSKYDTMTLDEIAVLPVGHLMRTGAVLWCWCTWPMIGKQAEIIKGWGFTVKTGGCWAKRTPSGKFRVGTGYILRSVCEPFLIATIGDDHGFGDGRARNFIETIEDAALDGVAREHSRKPEEAYRLVEDLTPNAFRADVFARQRRPGWDTFGLEADKFEEAPASAR